MALLLCDTGDAKILVMASLSRPHHIHPTTLGSSPQYIAYREAHTTKVSYVLVSNSCSSRATDTEPIDHDALVNNLTEPTDPPEIDDQPLVPAATLSGDDLQHFTATGRPITAVSPSSRHDLLTPYLLPLRYTDETIMPVVVKGVIPSPARHNESM